MCSGFPTQLLVLLILTLLGMKLRLPDGSLSGHFVFALTLTDTALLVGLVIFFLRAHHESPRDVLLGWRPVGRELALGVALIPVSFFVVVVVLLIVGHTLPVLHNVPHNPLQDLAHTRMDAILFALVVMIAGGLREEVQRGFVLHRFEQYLGGGAAGLVVFSTIFGLGHVEQGYDVAMATAILGAFWGAIYLARRSILGPMVGHADELRRPEPDVNGDQRAAAAASCRPVGFHHHQNERLLTHCSSPLPRFHTRASTDA